MCSNPALVAAARTSIEALFNLPGHNSVLSADSDSYCRAFHAALDANNVGVARVLFEVK